MEKQHFHAHKKMTHPTKQFRKLSTEFIHDGLKICSQNKNLLSEYLEYFPEIKDGKYRKLVKKSITDYEYFIENLISEKIEKLSTFQLLNSVISEQPIKNYYRNSFKERNEKIPLDVEAWTKHIPKKFLISYLKSVNDFIFNKNTFASIFRKFNNFLENYSQDEYIMPLYNFKYVGASKNISLNQIILRPITENELKIISGCDEQKTVSSIDSTLTHVIETKLLSNNVSEGFTKAETEFQLFFDALTLNFNGDLMMGRTYQNINSDWKTFEKGRKVTIHSIKNKLVFFEKNSQSFRIFHKTFKNSNLEEKENLFLKMAINRFRTGLNRVVLEDKIIDFVTSLESIYASGPGDITRKLSQRGAMILCKDEEKREEIYNFLKEGYNLRSGLVHGEENREFVINGKKLSLEEICKELEGLTRESIKIYLKLIKSYLGNRKNKKIINDIDSSLINRQKFTNLKKKY